MRIAFVDINDPSDRLNWSGAPFYMLQGLRRAGAEVVVVGPLRDWVSILFKIVAAAHSRLTGTSVGYDRHPILLRHYARNIERRLRRESHSGKFDCIVTPGAIPTAYLETAIPIVIWTDATVASMLGAPYYLEGVSEATIRQARESEERAIRGAALFVVAADWARQGAQEIGYPPEQTITIPFGASIEPAETAHRFIRSPHVTGPINVLIVGADWQRKGVDTCIAACEMVRDVGVDVSLQIVGAAPPAGVEVPSWVHIHGFLDKSDEADLAALVRLYKAAHLFVLPTRAECYGMVICEAAAFGLPVVAARVGGTDSAADHGRAGLLIDSNDPAAYQSEILRLVNNPDLYMAISDSARSSFESRLNWDAACRELLHTIRTRILESRL